MILKSFSSYSSSCMSHYWPVEKGEVSDIIGGKDAKSMGEPQFVPDRFGIEDSAIHVNSEKSVWQLPTDTYFEGESTLTLWAYKNNISDIGGLSTYGI